MNGDPQVQISGNLTADPELRFTASGVAVATFTVAHTPRVKRGTEWEDGPTLFLRCTAWRYLAEHVAESLARGQRVTVRGTLRANTWNDKNTGEKRTTIECTADDVGASLVYATAQVRKAARHAGDDAPPPADPWSGEQATYSERPAPSEGEAQGEGEAAPAAQGEA